MEIYICRRIMQLFKHTHMTKIAFSKWQWEATVEKRSPLWLPSRYQFVIKVYQRHELIVCTSFNRQWQNVAKRLCSAFYGVGTHKHTHTSNVACTSRSIEILSSNKTKYTKHKSTECQIGYTILSFLCHSNSRCVWVCLFFNVATIYVHIIIMKVFVRFI